MLSDLQLYMAHGEFSDIISTKRAGQSRQMTKFLPKHFPDMIIKTEDYCDRNKIISKEQLFCALVGAVSFRQSQQKKARFIAMII